jgi:hypothetical protein
MNSAREAGGSFSPRRKPWDREPSLTPSPLPPRRERGAEGRVRAVFPTTRAVGNRMPPLPGLRKGRLHGKDFLDEFLAQGFS